MALVPCPACGLPRTAADADSPCPTCEWAEPVPTSAVPQPLPVAPPAAEDVRPRNHGLFAAGGLVAAGVLAALVWPTTPPESQPTPEHPPPTTPAYVHIDPPPPAQPKSVEPSRDPLVIPIVVPVPVPPGDGFAVLKFDQPDELFQFPRLDAGNKVKLVGRVKRLIIEGVEGGSELDATGLDSDGISVSGKIDGGSTLRLKTDGGTISFKQGVRGGSVVELHAPKAYVSFPAAGSGGKAGSAVDGGSKLTVRAKAVVVGVPVTGAGTLLDLTFSPGGSLKLAAVEDQALVRYRPEHRADPMVKVTTALLAGGGEVREEAPR